MDSYQTHDRTDIECSVIVPLYNEAETIKELHERLAATMARLNIPYEPLFINDKSTDNTL